MVIERAIVGDVSCCLNHSICFARPTRTLRSAFVPVLTFVSFGILLGTIGLTSLGSDIEQLGRALVDGLYIFTQAAGAVVTLRIHRIIIQCTLRLKDHSPQPYLFSQHVSRIDFRKGSLIQLAHAHRVGCGGERQVSSSSSEASARSRAPAEYSYTFSTAIIIPAQRMLQPLPCFKPNSSDRRQRMPCRC